jgi:hypothetical protein
MRFKTGSKNADLDMSERGNGSKKLDPQTKALVRMQRGTLTAQQSLDLVAGAGSGLSTKELTKRLQRRATKGTP